MSASLFDEPLDCDLHESIPLPFPNVPDGSLLGYLHEVSLVTQMPEGEQALMESVYEGAVPTKCVRWDGIRRKCVHWCRKGMLNVKSIEGSALGVRKYDELRRDVHRQIKAMPRRSTEDDISHFNEECRQWEDTTIELLREWNWFQSNTVRLLKVDGHPLIYDGMATGELGFPHGISWTSGDGSSQVRMDSWRAEMHLAHVLRALVLLKSGLRMAGMYLFFHTKEAVDKANMETYKARQAKSNDPVEWSWSKALDQAKERFGEAFGVLASLKSHQRGWDFLNTCQLKTQAIYEMRPAFAPALQTLAMSMIQRCSYLKDFLWQGVANAVIKYREDRRRMYPVSSGGSAATLMSLGGSSSQQQQENPDDLLKAFSSQTAMDRDLWLEFESREFNVKAIGCLALCEEASGAALHHLQRCYLPEEQAQPLLDLAESFHSLHRGALIYHMGSLLIKSIDFGCEIMSTGLASEGILSVLRNISASVEAAILTQQAKPAADEPGIGTSEEEPENEPAVEKLLPSQQQPFELPMLSLELGMGAQHLTKLHMTNAMKDSLVRGEQSTAWSEALRGEVISLYIKESGRLEQHAQIELTRLRNLSASEYEKMRFCATVGMIPIWQNLLMSCLVNEVLIQQCGAKDSSDWTLCQDQEVVKKLLTARPPLDWADGKSNGVTSSPSSESACVGKWSEYVKDCVVPYRLHGEERARAEQSLWESMHKAPLTYQTRMQLTNLRFFTVAEISLLTQQQLDTESIIGDKGWVDGDIMKVALARMAIYYMERANSLLAHEWRVTYEHDLQMLRDSGVSASGVQTEDLFKLVVRGGATLDDLVFGLALDYKKFAELVQFAQGQKPQVEQDLFFKRLACSYIDVWSRLCHFKTQQTDWVISWRLFWNLQLTAGNLLTLGCTMNDMIKERMILDLPAAKYLGSQGLCLLGLNRQLLCMLPGLANGQHLEHYCRDYLGWNESNILAFMRRFN